MPEVMPVSMVEVGLPVVTVVSVSVSVSLASVLCVLIVVLEAPLVTVGVAEATVLSDSRTK
jgi:hypothetical protein